MASYDWFTSETSQYQTYLTKLAFHSATVKCPLFNPQYKLMGVQEKDAQAPAPYAINARMELMTENAQTIRMFNMEPVTSEPIVGSVNLKGTGVSIGTNNWELSIGQQAWTIQRNNVVMSNQVALFNWSKSALVQQGERFADWSNLVALGKLAGLTMNHGALWKDRGKGPVDYSSTKWQAYNGVGSIPTHYRVFPSGISNDTGCTTSTHKMTPNMIHQAIDIARDRYLGFDATNDGLICLIKNQQWQQLMSDTTWATSISEDVAYRGAERNARWTGKTWRYNDVKFILTDYVPYGESNDGTTQVSTCARAILMGANALSVAWGSYNKTDVDGNGYLANVDTWSKYDREAQVEENYFRVVCGMKCPQYTPAFDSLARTNRVVISSFNGYV